MRNFSGGGESPNGAHRRAKWTACPRKYHLSKTREKHPMYRFLIGTIVHQMLAQHFDRQRLYQSDGDPNDFYSPDEEEMKVKFLAELKAVEEGNPAEYSVDGIWAEALDHYRVFRKWCVRHRVLENWEIIATEYVLEWTVNDPESGPVVVTQSADLVLRNRIDGKVYLVDHKWTGARSPASMVGRYAMDDQFVGYWAFGERIWGEEFGGVLIFLLKNEGKDKYGHPYRVNKSCELVAVPRFPKLVSAWEPRAVMASRIAQAYEGLPLDEIPAIPSYTNCKAGFGCPYTEFCFAGSTFGALPDSFKS